MVGAASMHAGAVLPATQGGARSSTVSGDTHGGSRRPGQLCMVLMPSVGALPSPAGPQGSRVLRHSPANAAADEGGAGGGLPHLRR